MFVYFVNYFNWSDSVHYPITHDNEYTKEEFKKICDDASLKAIEQISGHNTDIHLEKVSISKYELLDGIVDVLCSDFGFSHLNVMCYDIDEELVDVHNKL